MQKNRVPYINFHVFSSLLMMLALLWLTVSLPFVYQAQKQQAAITKNSSKISQQDPNNLLNNSTEEKVPSTTQEEYLHHQDEFSHKWVNTLEHFSDHTVPVFIAFHGELLSPPPEA